MDRIPRGRSRGSCPGTGERHSTAPATPCDATNDACPLHFAVVCFTWYGAVSKRFEILGDTRNQTVTRAPTGTGGDFEPFATLELCSCGWWLRVPLPSLILPLVPLPFVVPYSLLLSNKLLLKQLLDWILILLVLSISSLCWISSPVSKGGEKGGVTCLIGRLLILSSRASAVAASTPDHGRYGLQLRVYPSRSRSWEQRIRIDGRERTIGLGSYPAVTLAQAREAALANKRLIVAGRDPLRERRRDATVPTLASAFETYVSLQNWRSQGEAPKWRQMFARYIPDALASRSVSSVDTDDLVSVLVPLFTVHKDTGRRLLHRLRRVMEWAVSKKLRIDNPAGRHIRNLLPKPQRGEHHPALPHREVAQALAAVRMSGSTPITKLAMEFVILTASRPGEVCDALWSDFDLGERLWRLPGKRMKAGETHVVPLPPPAIDVLNRARELAPSSVLVFPSFPSGKALSANALPKLLRTLNLACVPHGFRSSFRDWCGDTGQDRQVSEASLAHKVGSDVELAYLRTDFIDRRRVLLAQWADYALTSSPSLPHDNQ